MHGCVSGIAQMAMRVPQELALHNILFLNMEHSSCKSHVADVTMTGADVIYHKEHYWDKDKQNTFLWILFCLLLPSLPSWVCPWVHPHGA